MVGDVYESWLSWAIEDHGVRQRAHNDVSYKQYNMFVVVIEEPADKNLGAKILR